MSDTDLILICQSDMVDYGAFSKFPVKRLDLFETLVYPRMVHQNAGFRSHLDVLNQAGQGRYYQDADYAGRRDLLNIWNLPAASGIHVANCLLADGIRTRVINNFDSEWDWFCEAYENCRTPPLVGISSTFYLSFKEIGRLTRKLLDFDPEMEIALGGAFANGHATGGSPLDFEKPMRRYGIKYALHAFNSELDLRDLILARKGGRSPDTVRNLCYLDGKKAKTASFETTQVDWNKPVLKDAPSLWHELDLPFLNKTIQIRTASGCPFSCAFCSYPTTAGGWKTQELDRVRQDLDSISRIPDIENIIFIDDTFNVPPHRFKELLKLFCEYDFEWFSFLRVQYADEEIVELMRESGCRGVYLGVESANDQVLTNMNKRARRKDFMTGLDRLNQNDILSLAAFVLGFPGENDESIRDNIDFIENAGVSYYSLKEFYLIEDTKVHNERHKYGLSGSGGNWRHDTMTSDQAARLKIDMFKSIKNSTFIDPDTSLWYFAYLYDQGFDFPTINRLQQEINSVMLDQINGRFDNNHPAYDRIAAIMRGAGRANQNLGRIA